MFAICVQIQKCKIQIQMFLLLPDLSASNEPPPHLLPTQPLFPGGCLPAVFHVIVVGPNQVSNPVKNCRNLSVNFRSPVLAISQSIGANTNYTLLRSVSSVIPEEHAAP